MKISVCVAIYNGSRFLKEQLGSILKEVGRTDEIVVVDDASSDNSVQLVKKLKNKRIKTYVNDFNIGPIRTFERALKNTNGDIIFFADQDDIWIRGKVKKTLDVFKKVKPAAVVSDAVVVDEKGNVISESFFKKMNSSPGVIKNYYKNTYIGACMAIDARAKKWLLPFPENISMHDKWIGLTCDFVGGVYFLNEPLIYYRRHQGAFTKDRRFPMRKVLVDRLIFLTVILKRAPNLFFWRWKLRNAMRL